MNRFDYHFFVKIQNFSLFLVSWNLLGFYILLSVEFSVTETRPSDDWWPIRYEYLTLIFYSSRVPSNNAINMYSHRTPRDIKFIKLNYIHAATTPPLRDSLSRKKWRKKLQYKMWSNLRCWLFLSAEITGPDRMCNRLYHLHKLFLLPVNPPFTLCSRFGSVPTFLPVLFSLTICRCCRGVVKVASTLLVEQLKKFLPIPSRGKWSFPYANCPGWILGPICIPLPFLRLQCRG
jgi:hypothetical protein